MTQNPLKLKYELAALNWAIPYVLRGSITGALLALALLIFLGCGSIQIAYFAALLTILAGILWGINCALIKSHKNPCDLTDWQIATQGKNWIEPFSYELIEPDSYDVTLNNTFHRILPDGSTKDITCSELIIQPGESWLAHTQEKFSLPNDVKGILQGKSSWARLGLFVESAGLFDKGFQGTAVLELFNAGSCPILLKENDPIAQMSFHRTLPAAAPYGNISRKSHYQGQEGPTPSWLSKSNRLLPKP